jgi:hypothetical protein
LIPGISIGRSPQNAQFTSMASIAGRFPNPPNSLIAGYRVIGQAMRGIDCLF